MIESIPTFEEMKLDGPAFQRETQMFLSTIYPNAFKEWWTTDPAIAYAVYGVNFRIKDRNFLETVKELTEIARKRPSLANFRQAYDQIYRFCFLKEEDLTQFVIESEGIAIIFGMLFKRENFSLNYYDIEELYKRNIKLFGKEDLPGIKVIGNLFEDMSDETRELLEMEIDNPLIDRLAEHGVKVKLERSDTQSWPYCFDFVWTVRIYELSNSDLGIIMSMRGAYEIHKKLEGIATGYTEIVFCIPITQEEIQDYFTRFGKKLDNVKIITGSRLAGKVDLENAIYSLERSNDEANGKAISSLLFEGLSL